MLMAATTHWALTPVCVTLPMSWDLMENSVTVSLNPLNVFILILLHARKLYIYVAQDISILDTHYLTVNL